MVAGEVHITEITYERHTLFFRFDLEADDVKDLHSVFARRLHLSLGGWRHSLAILSFTFSPRGVRCLVDEAELLWLLKRHRQVEGNSEAAKLIADRNLLEESQRAKKPLRKRQQNITTLRRWAFLCAVELRKKEPGYIVIGDAAGKAAFRNGVPEREDIEYL